MFEQHRLWLESIALQATGRKLAVAAAQVDAVGSASGSDAAAREESKAAEKKLALRAQAMADSGVQAMLEVFPAEIRDVEEM